MELLSSTPIPCSGDDVCAVGNLAYNDHYVSVALNDRSVHVFSLSDGSHKLAFTESGDKLIWGLALVHDLIITGTGDGSLTARNIVGGSETSTIRSPSGSQIKYILGLTSAPPSILASARDGTIRQWVIGSPSYSREYAGGHSATVFRMQAYDTDSRFVSMAWEGTTVAWDVKSSSIIWKNTQEAQVFSFAIDETVVAVGRSDGIVKILKLTDGSEIASIEAHSKIVNGLIFYQHYLLSTGTDGFLKILSVSDSKEVYRVEKEIRLFDHAITARCMLGNMLVTAGKDGGGEENACGLDMRIKTIKINIDDDVEILELGMPVVVAWSLIALERIGKIVIVIRKRGRPTLEMWNDSSALS